jgi:HAD superfamily hydrolase (TIGR01549 family)
VANERAIIFSLGALTRSNIEEQSFDFHHLRYSSKELPLLRGFLKGKRLNDVFKKTHAAISALYAMQKNSRYESPNVRQILADVLGMLGGGQTAPDPVLEEVLSFMARSHEIKLGKKTRDMLLSLTAHGYVLGIVANMPIPFANYVDTFAADEILDCFWSIIFSSDVGFMKPNSEIFAYAAESIEFKPQEVIFVGDRLQEDIAPLLKFQSRTVLLNWRRQTTELKKWKKENGQAKLQVIDSIGDIRKVL